MGKLNINRNIFLEKEELLRFQQFVTDENIATKVILDNTTNWGIVRTVFEGTSPDFLVEVGTNLGTIKIDSLSKAVTASKLLIEQQVVDNISVPSDGLWYWVKISHQYSHLEVGECSININGEVSGTETLFTDVLRGQSTEVPVKIKFYKSGGVTNDQIYEVVDVIDDTNIILTGGSFAAESGLSYIVIGSTPISETLTAEQKEGLYQYDSCLLEFILEEITDTPPVTNYVEDEQFYIARVRNVAGTVTVQDKRGGQFLTFNVEGVNTKLGQSANLSDLTDVSEARNNLDVYSKSEVDGKISNSATQTTAYSSKNASISSLSVIGRNNNYAVSVVGKMSIGSKISANSVLFTMSLPAGGISGQLIAGCMLPQDGNFDNSRVGRMEVTKVVVRAIQYVKFSVSPDIVLYDGTYVFNLMWLPN